jgi:hypothetical protein
MNKKSSARTLATLSEANLHHVYKQSKQEVLREHAFRIKLESTNSVEKLETLVFEAESGLDRWTEQELLEISNRFRLLGSPENEIRLYEESRKQIFRNISRAREFYILALNKVDRLTDAIEECRRLIAEGDENGLVWGTFGDSYTIRMLSAERFTEALKTVEGDINRVDIKSKEQFQKHFPDINIDSVTIPRAQALRRQTLESAKQIYHKGFQKSGSSFPGLGWMMCTIEQWTDILAFRARLLDKQRQETLVEQEVKNLRQAEERITTLEGEIESQATLIKIALEMEGGIECLDYWTHVGELQLALIQGSGIAEIEPILARAFTTVDAEFKIVNTLDRFTRIRNQYTKALEITRAQGEDIRRLEQTLETMNTVITELNAGKKRLIAGGQKRGEALNERYRALAEVEPKNGKEVFLKKTINFHSLTNNLVPQHIPGGIGRMGARVPDLAINRSVQEDLQDLIKVKVIQVLTHEEGNKPKALITKIQELVGEGLGVSDLQDLQSPGHHEFNTRSDGLIALSGIDPDMRRGTRSTTDLTASLLMRTGDCRETMYLNGALFACYQQMKVYGKLAEAVECLDLGYQEGFHRITTEEIPEIIRYQLRGGHVSVYVDSIAMKQKYYAERVSKEDSTAIQRRYGVKEFRLGQPLTQYELENSKIRINYKNGTTIMIEPKDSIIGKWCPIEHTHVEGGGGIPTIPDAGPKGENIAAIQLLNLVEEHTISFLYDVKTGETKFCDGFYNETFFESPYQFGSATLDTNDIINNGGLIRAGKRDMIGAEGLKQSRQVFIEFLHFSTTDYEPSLGEGDILTSFLLMGRTFDGNLTQERRRLEEGSSSIPTVLEKVYEWQVQQQEVVAQQTKAIDQRFAKVMIDLARDHPELIQLQDVKDGQNLIAQDQESDSVYLVLSGSLQVYKDGKLLTKDGEPVTVETGGIVGEISALKGGLPTASVTGDAAVLRISKAEFRRQLDINTTFKQSVEELVDTRLKELHAESSGSYG